MTASPNLAPPGAGLPFWERWLAHASLKTYMVRSNPQSALQTFHNFGSSLKKLVASLNENEGRTQVLVPKIVGIEDSSRFWSAYMVLHHLVIVESGVIEILRALTSEKSFEREVRIAAVKPSHETGPEIIPKFVEVEKLYGDFIRSCPSLKTKMRHRHPWFGMLDAYGWHCLMTLHRSVHRKQLKQIIDGLPDGQ